MSFVKFDIALCELIHGYISNTQCHMILLLW